MEFNIDHLEPSDVPLGYIATVKYMDADGSVCILHTFDEVSPWEALGMIEAHRDYLKGMMRDDREYLDSDE